MAPFDPVSFTKSMQASCPELGQNLRRETDRCAVAQDPAQVALERHRWRRADNREVGDLIE